MYIHSHLIKVLTLKISYLPCPWNCQTTSVKPSKATITSLGRLIKRFYVWKGLNTGSDTFIVKFNTWIRHFLLIVTTDLGILKRFIWACKRQTCKPAQFVAEHTTQPQVIRVVNLRKKKKFAFGVKKGCNRTFFVFFYNILNYFSKNNLK